MHPIFPPFPPLLFSTPLTACHLLTRSWSFLLVFILVAFSFLFSCLSLHPLSLLSTYMPLLIHAHPCFMLLCLPYYSCICSLHTYHSRHASWSHFIHAFTPVILITLIFICALLFLSSSYAIQLVHSIHALAHLINLIPAHHFITVYTLLMFTVCSCLSYLQCLHTCQVIPTFSLFMLIN